MPLTLDMTADDLVASLDGLERPARYLGAELGARPNNQPDDLGRLLTVALAFPDVYEIAHGHLGHKILYHMLNSAPGFRAERVYAPWTDLASRLSEAGAPLRSLESRARLSSFDVIGFSLQYEMAYTTILDILRLAKVPLLSKERDESWPLICAGGPGASNPEPMADFLDIVFIGDAEAFFMEDLALVKEWRYQKAPKSELFERLAGRPGIYIPSLFEPVYQGVEFKGLEPLKRGYDRVFKATAPTLSGAPFPACQIVPLVKPVHDRVVVEIGRGCSRGCRFCQAGYLYRPARERSAEEIMSLTELNLAATGHDQAAFLSLSAGDHTQIGPLVESFMDRFADESVALSLPSLRVRSLSNHLARQIRRVRKTGFTMAPEAGTARLRSVINKDLTEDDIFTAAEAAFGLGWRSLKLYFMAGLPTETDDDLAAIVDLSRRLGRLYKARLNIGLAHFTPKAHTPFQWGPGSDLSTIESRLGRVKAAARAPGLVVRYNDPGVSMIEGVLSRGGRRLAPLVAEVSRLGGRLEAWNDHFRLDRWLAAMSATGLGLDSLLSELKPGDLLPWSHLSCGVTEEFLFNEFKKALSAQPTPDCRIAGCQNCGACRDGVKIDLADPGFWSRQAETEIDAEDRQSFKEAQSAAESQPAAGAQTGPESQSATRIQSASEAQSAAKSQPIAEAQSPSEAQAAAEAHSGEDSPAATEAQSGATAQTKKPAPAALAGNPPNAGAEPKSLAPGQAPSKSSGRSKNRKAGKPQPNAQEGRETAPIEPGHRFLARFAKEGALVLIGHLEMAEIFKKAFRRAGLPLQMSRGFHPQPRLVFMTALPVGLASLDECLYFELSKNLEPKMIFDSLILPEGLRMLSVRRLPSPGPKPRVAAIRYEIEASDPALEGPPLNPEAILSYSTGKGAQKEFALSDFVQEASPAEQGLARLTIRVDPAGTPKIAPVIKTLWGLPEEWTGAIKKIATILDTDPRLSRSS